VSQGALERNSETLRSVLFSRNYLLLFTLRTDRRRRRLYPAQLGRFDLVRLRSTRDVERFLSGL
jgi:hypothetical protein